MIQNRSQFQMWRCSESNTFKYFPGKSSLTKAIRSQRPVSSFLSRKGISLITSLFEKMPHFSLMAAAIRSNARVF